MTVELKNDTIVRGRLDAVDDYLNLRMSNLSLADASVDLRHVTEVFIRGSSIRYISLGSDASFDAQELTRQVRVGA